MEHLVWNRSKSAESKVVDNIEILTEVFLRT